MKKVINLFLLFHIIFGGVNTQNQDAEQFLNDMIKKAEAGDFDLWVGTNSEEGLKARFSIK